jgi:hypothetical protein
VGGIISSRLGTDGQYNISYGADAIIKLFGDDYLNLKLAQVMSDSADNQAFSLDPTGIFVNWKRFKNKGFGYNFTYARYGKDFEAGTGFQMRSDYTFFNGALKYGRILGESSRFQSDNVEINFLNYLSNETGKTESTSVNAGYVFMTKSSMFAYTGISHQYEHVTDSFSFSDDAHVPPGEYTFNLLEIHGQTPETKPFFVGMDLFAGTFYDGSRLSINLMPTWNLSATLQLKTEYEYNRLRFQDRGQRFDGHIARIRALLMVSTSLSFSAFVQFNNADHNIVANLRLHYNPREGNDFYIVYNEGRNTTPDREVPRMPSLSDRVLLLKYTYTFSARK